MLWRVWWLVVLILSAALSLWRLSPPGRDVGGFSTPSALEHLRFIASERRPVGSAFHQQVRDYLVQQFSRLGYDVSTQDTAWEGVPLSNVIARRAGSTPGNKAVMLAAHYDSVPTGPGAADDGAAVAALLEIARILAQHPHRNDLIFLITDAEESPLGLPGSGAFVAQNPLAKTVGVVMNFEARGTCGPSIMFETSNDNAWLIDLLARVDPHPVCSSLTYDVYKRMPNDTDFTVFRDAGHMQGLNFAFIGGYANYHRPTDDLAHLDPRSLRHHGIQALALASKLLEMDLSSAAKTSRGNDVYFDVLSLFVVRYPSGWAPALAIAATVSALASIAFAAWQRGIRRSIGGGLASGGGLVINILLVWGIFRLINLATSHVNLAVHADWVIAGDVLLASAATLGCIGILNRWIEAAWIRAAGLGVWSILAIASGFGLPGASYLAVWPLICGSAAMLLALLPIDRKLAGAGILLLLILPIILLAPMIYLAFLGLTLRNAPTLVVLVVLTLWLLPPLGPQQTSHKTECLSVRELEDGR